MIFTARWLAFVPLLLGTSGPQDAIQEGAPREEDVFSEVPS